MQAKTIVGCVAILAGIAQSKKINTGQKGPQDNMVMNGT